MAEKKLTGRIAREKIKMMDVPRPPAGVVERFKKLGDCTGVISDTMDELGIPLGAVGASVLKPTMPGTIMVGPALTLRNILQRIDPLAGARDHVNKMAEFECHNLATAGRRPGDRGRAEHLQHGRQLGADRQAPGRSRRHRARRHPRHRAFSARSAIRSGRATSRRSPANGGSRRPRSTARS